MWILFVVLFIIVLFVFLCIDVKTRRLWKEYDRQQEEMERADGLIREVFDMEEEDE